MIVLHINEYELKPGVTHNRTDWQVSRNLAFTDIVIESMYDAVNKTTIIFDVDADPDTTYYARSRMLLNTGYTVWSNVDVFTPTDVTLINFPKDRPCNIATPNLYTNYDVNGHPETSFYVRGSQFASDGKTAHVKTHWVIRDESGNVVFARYDDDTNLTNLFVTVILPVNKVLTISASYVSSSGDCSEYGSVTIYTSRDDRMVMPFMLDYINIATASGPAFEVVAASGYTIDYIKWAIEYEPTPDTKMTAIEQIAWTSNQFISFDWLNDVNINTRYVVTVKAMVGGAETHTKSCYFTFTDRDVTYSNDDPDAYDEVAGDNTLPAPLPYHLGN